VRIEEPVYIDDPKWLKRLKRNINNDHVDDDPTSTLEKDVRKKLCDGESPRTLLKNIEKLIGHNDKKSVQ
jgi:hypothetical protein